MSDAATLVGKLWSYCSVLRDDGLSYGDYLEQLTFLLFLKMADELTKPPFNRPSIVPEDLDWASLLSKQGAELETQYSLILNELGRSRECWEWSSARLRTAFRTRPSSNG